MYAKRGIIKKKVRGVSKTEALKFHFFARVHHRFGIDDTEACFQAVVDQYKMNHYEVFLRISNRIVCFDSEYHEERFFVLFDTKRKVPITAMPMDWKDEMIEKHRESYQTTYKGGDFYEEDIFDRIGAIAT